jgi:hypothetical protein
MNDWDKPDFFLGYSKHQIADIILEYERYKFLEEKNGEPFTLKEVSSEHRRAQ